MPQSTTQVFRFEDLSAGQVFAVSESYGEREMIAFEMLSNDHSPLHVDAEATRLYGYPDRMVYGFLFLTLLSRFVGRGFITLRARRYPSILPNRHSLGEQIDLIAKVERIQQSLRCIEFKARFLRGDDVLARGRISIELRNKPGRHRGLGFGRPNQTCAGY